MGLNKNFIRCHNTENENSLYDWKPLIFEYIINGQK